MNLQGLHRFGAADEAVVRRVIELAEKEGVWLVGVQELWFKNKRNHAAGESENRRKFTSRHLYCD